MPDAHAAVKTQSRRVAEIRAHLAMAVRRIVRATYAAGPLYAQAIRAVIAAEKAHLSRMMIAKIIRAEHEAERRRRWVKHTTGKIEELPVKVHKGTAARYVMLARWEQQHWLKGEKHPESVEIEGHEYRSPLRALDSGTCSFSRVFRAWREAVRPPLTDLSVVPTSPQEAAERVVKRLTLPMLVTEDGVEGVRRVKVMESAEAMAALLTLIYASPHAKEAERLRELASRDVVRRPLAERRQRKTSVAA